MLKQKSLNKRRWGVNNKMKKRGQADVVIGGVILITIIIFGSYQFINALSENRYMLDKSTNILYDLSKCSIKDLDQSKLVSVRDLNELKGKDYKIAKC